ncbi:MAG: tryptophan-rich sensory protein [Citricoccus sp.]|nr:tryptophan-rich sensory protein [Citricoccus sp. WCRC_4]
MSTAPAHGPARPVRASGAAGVLGTRTGQTATAVVIVLAIVSAFVGSGAIGGTPIVEAADGWLTADSTWIAPAGPAFSIWSVIYAGLVGYGIWQFFPAADTPRHHAARPWILAGVVLNSAWIWVVQAGWLAVSVLVIVLLLVCLCRVLVILESARYREAAPPVTAAGAGASTAPSRGSVARWTERILLDGVQGLYLGWVTVATLANVAAWLASLGWTGAPLGPVVWATILVVVATLIATATALYDGGRFAPALATAWGLAWIAVGRSDGSGLQSASLALTAAGASVLVVLATIAAWLLSRRSVTGEARDLIADALDGDGDPIDGR